MEQQYYHIAGFQIRIAGEEAEAIRRIPGFEPFEAEPSDCPDFTLEMIREMGADNMESQQPLHTFDMEGTKSTLARTADGSYRFGMVSPTGETLTVTHHPGSHTCLVAGSKEPPLLRFALWTAFGLLTYREAIAVHSSVIECNGRAVMFLGESGTGKSTHTRLWCQHIPGARLLNDDSPVLRVIEGTPYIYGSPWSGKRPCYRNERCEPAAIVRLSQAPHNCIRRLSTFEAFGALYPSCPPAFASDRRLTDGICNTLSGVLTRVPVYHLECLPDEAAAQLSYQTVLR